MLQGACRETRRPARARPGGAPASTVSPVNEADEGRASFGGLVTVSRGAHRERSAHAAETPVRSPSPLEAPGTASKTLRRWRSRQGGGRQKHKLPCLDAPS